MDKNINDALFTEFENSYTNNLTFLNDIGIVLSCADGIVKVTGLLNVAYGEMVYFSIEDLKIIGLVLNLEADIVSIVVLDKDIEIKPGYLAFRTHELMSVPCGEGLLGRVVDPLGRPLDGKIEEIEVSEFRLIESKAPSIIARASVNVPLETGL